MFFNLKLLLPCHKVKKFKFIEAFINLSDNEETLLIKINPHSDASSDNFRLRYLTKRITVTIIICGKLIHVLFVHNRDNNLKHTLANIWSP